MWIQVKLGKLSHGNSCILQRALTGLGPVPAPAPSGLFCSHLLSV